MILILICTIMRVFSVYDCKCSVYNTPFFSKHSAEAERSFTSIANDPKSMICQYSEDYTLYKIGS